MSASEYLPDFIDQQTADEILSALTLDLVWERREGAPRSEYWTNKFGRPYTYGRGAGQRTYQPHATHPAIELVSDKLQERLGFRYEGCFLNRYDNEREALGWHADDDSGIDHSKPIAVVTLGQPREIQMKRQLDDSRNVERQLLGHGSLFLMKAGAQSTHFHRIPKATFQAKTRISLTYRSLLPEYAV